MPARSGQYSKIAPEASGICAAATGQKDEKFAENPADRPARLVTGDIGSRIASRIGRGFPLALAAAPL